MTGVFCDSVVEYSWVDGRAQNQQSHGAIVVLDWGGVSLSIEFREGYSFTAK